MAKYHINPATGKAGVCSAEIQCRFGPGAEHFASEEAARSAYEAKQVVFTGTEAPSTPVSFITPERDLEIAESVIASVYSLPDDLDGSVPYVSDFRAAADNFIATLADEYGDKPTRAQVHDLAEQWAKEYSDMPSAMIGGHALAELSHHKF